MRLLNCTVYHSKSDHIFFRSIMSMVMYSAWHSSDTVYFVLMFRVATDVCSYRLNVLFDHLQSFKDTAMSVDPRKWTLIFSLLSLNVTSGKSLFPLFAHALNYLQSNVFKGGRHPLSHILSNLWHFYLFVTSYTMSKKLQDDGERPNHTTTSNAYFPDTPSKQTEVLINTVTSQTGQ